MRAALSAIVLAASLSTSVPARAQATAPLSRWDAQPTRVGRPAFVVGAGWPAVVGEIDFGVNDALGVGIRAGYLYAAPHAGIRLAQGALVELPARLLVLRRGAVEVVFEATAGVAIGTDRSLATLSEEIAPELRIVAPKLDLGLLVSWPLGRSVVLKFGLELPTVLALDMVEQPMSDVLELTMAFAPQLGVSWAATGWLSLFCLAGAGPALVWAPVEHTSDGWRHEVRVEPHLRFTAGLVFTPFR